MASGDPAGPGDRLARSAPRRAWLVAVVVPVVWFVLLPLGDQFLGWTV